MLSLVLTIRRLFVALMSSLKEPEFRNILLILLIVLFSGTIFYHTVEKWSVIDALYFSVTTLSTVGYGDLSPQTDIGKIFTILYIFSGLGLFVAVATHLGKNLSVRHQKSHDQAK